MSKIAEVYDLECLSNYFSYTGYDYKNDKWNVFEIAPWKNQARELVDYVRNNVGLMIGFNNEAYDYPLLHHIINHIDEYENGFQVPQKIYKKSQELIDMQFSAIADRNKYIPQMDLYLIWHYNNKARHQS